MSIALFEEREYERSLYDELRVSNRRLWSPGQVLENRVGFDTALFAEYCLPLYLHRGAVPPGLVLGRYHWLFHRELRVPRTRRLPNFELNLFIQAKRPRRLKSSARAVAAQGVAGAHYAFTLDSEQQAILEKLESRFGSKAVVCYAAPVFHTEAELYKRTISGTVSKTSSYPAPSWLSGHSNWHYKVPGASGVAKSTPVAIDGASLEQRVAHLGDGRLPPSELPPAGAGGPDDNSWQRNLKALASAIDGEMRDIGLPETFARARYFGLKRELVSDLDDLGPAPDWMRAYVEVVAFLVTYKMLWLCVS